ncbi:MAG TPA: LamG-like jellyroll fold domain-containing protein [Oculatellaceae cyanobacterium]
MKPTVKPMHRIQYHLQRSLFFFSLLCLCVSSSEKTLAQPAPPTISAGSGVYNNNANLGSISITSPGNTIYYNIGSTQPPTTSSTPYTGTFYSVSQINAIAVSGGLSSPVATSVIVIDPDASSPCSQFAFINSNTQFWYRGDSGYLTNSGGNNLTYWGDVSGQNNASGVSPSYPVLQTAANNGLYAVSFSGSNFLSLPSGFSNFSSGLSLFAVVQPTVLSSGAQILSLGDGSNLNNAISLSENASYQPTFSVYSSTGSPTSVASTSAFNTSHYQLVEIVQTGSTATLYVNGTQVGQNSSMNSLPSTTLSNNYIGQSTTGGGYFKGQISELLLYNTAVTPSQRAQIEAYYLGKYQLPLQSVAATLVPSPVFSLLGGTLSQPSQLAISGQPDATIYVTTDGSTPSSSSLEYANPFSVNFSQTVKAIAVTPLGQSSVTSATYTLDGTKWPAPASGGPTLKINVTSPNVAN